MHQKGVSSGACYAILSYSDKNFVMLPRYLIHLRLSACLILNVTKREVLTRTPKQFAKFFLFVDKNIDYNRRRWLGSDHYNKHDPNRAINPSFDSKRVALEVVNLMNQCDFVFAYEHSNHDTNRIGTMLESKVSDHLQETTSIINFYNTVVLSLLTTDPFKHPDKIYVTGFMQLEIWKALFLGDEHLMSLFSDILLPTEFPIKDKCISDVNMLTNIFRVIQRILFTDYFSVGKPDVTLGLMEPLSSRLKRVTPFTSISPTPAINSLYKAFFARATIVV